MSESSSSNRLSNIHKFGPLEIIIFLLSLISGTIYSTSSKIVMDMQGSIANTSSAGNDTSDEVSMTAPFQKPLFVTFGLFFGMLLGLVVHWIVLVFRIPFLGYEFNAVENSKDDNNDKVDTGHQQKRSRRKSRTEQEALLIDPTWNCDDYENAEAPPMRVNVESSVPMGLFFTLGAGDVAAATLCMIGLQFVEVSIYQMLRGSSMVFIALMKQYVMKEHLYTFHWMGIFWNMISVIIVGATALLVSSSTEEGGLSSDNSTVVESLWGVFLIVLGSFIFSILCLIIEQRMKMDVPAPLLVGMMGFWGTVLCIFVIFPLGYYIPGDDNGSYEDPFLAWSMFVNSRNIQMAMIVYCLSAFVYNIAVTIMFGMLSSVWGGILENFRSIAVWALDVFIFYCINSSFGESWTQYSYLQIVGMAVLILGTAIYNAPNECSILLKGQWWAFGINLLEEYDMVRAEQEKEQEAHVDYLEYENLADEYDTICHEKKDGEVV